MVGNTILIIKTPGCGHCEEVMEIIDKKIKPDFPDLDVEVIDVTQKPEYLQKYPVMSAPGIVINGKLEFQGVATEQQIRSKLKE
ncbi:MAG: thioredoxin family protein [DPANN group archaeon]|nr:thioredoxin family protein [DPANN group archaeon]